jgi:hypothetical protein
MICLPLFETENKVCLLHLGNRRFYIYVSGVTVRRSTKLVIRSYAGSWGVSVFEGKVCVHHEACNVMRYVMREQKFKVRVGGCCKNNCII